VRDVTCKARISDVAAAAEVGISTVSNVLNHPHRVAVGTRERVERAIASLSFERSEEAVKLRRGRGSRPQMIEAIPDATDPVSALDPAAASPEPAKCEPTRASGSWPDLKPGTRVHVAVDGVVVGGGTVDTVLPDGSAVWLWMDSAGGRRLIHSQDGMDIGSTDPVY
jgi:hypothetical protein